MAEGFTAVDVLIIGLVIGFCLGWIGGGLYLMWRRERRDG